MPGVEHMMSQPMKHVKNSCSDPPRSYRGGWIEICSSWIQILKRLQGRSHDRLRKQILLPEGYLPSEIEPRTTPSSLPEVPIIALIDPTAHQTIGPDALQKLERYLGTRQVCFFPSL
jgi:hypothetical protein